MSNLWTKVFSVFLLLPCTSLTQSPSQPSPCTATLTVSSNLTLQQALDTAASTSDGGGGSGGNASHNCASIQVPSGDHTLTSQTLLPEEVGDIEIVGMSDSVYITCEYGNGRAANYTWYFAGLKSVRMKGLKFEECPRPLRLDTVAEVEIQSCSFRFFAEAVLDVFNCHHTLMNDSLLEHNFGTGFVNDSYRGNTGGVSFGYNTLPPEFNSPRLRVMHTEFRNNSATASSAFLTTSEAFFAQVFTGRGGALAVFSNESTFDLDVVISNCLFEENFARSFGGGAYLLLGGFMTRHKIMLEGVRVRKNVAQLGGGGVQASFFNVGLEDDPLLMAFEDCEFSGNRGIAGGGVFVFTSTDGGVGNLARFRSTLFSGNRGYLEGSSDYGAAIALSLLNPLVERSNFPRHEITDCIFDSNTGANGIVSVGYSPMNFTGRNLFSNNNGTGLRVVGAKVYLSGELHFINNTATSVDEADSALHMLSFGQLVLGRGLVMNFQGNTGRFGASISIEATTTSTVYTRLAANPQCPFLYEDPGAVPQDWSNVTVSFSDNSAILGSTIFISRLNTCSWYSRSPPFFNNTFIVDWPIWNIDSSNQDTGYTAEEQMNSTLSVQTQVTRLVMSNTTVRAWPGLRLRLGVSGWDEFSHTTTATAGFSFKPLNDSLGIPDIRFIPEVVVIGPDPTTGLLTRYFTVYYGIGSASSDRDLRFIEGVVGNVTIQDPIETLPVASAEFRLEALVCPAGYVLRPHSTQTGISVCTCNEDIADLLLCNEDQETVVITRGKWAAYVPSAPQSNVHFYSCPTGYCRCRHDNSINNNTCVYSYSHGDPDLQCECNRRGTLCGECRDEREGVSALLNECVSCDNASGLLILALIILNAVVILLLVLIDRPLPSWIYPFIFYMQLAPIVGLDFPDSFNDIGRYLYFLGSASGFYFIYDFCLYDNMSSQMAYFLRYLPLFVGILTCTPIIIGRSYIYRMFLKRKPLQHHGLWLVLLLAYSHLVHTSMTILNCPSIIISNGDTSPRWYVNGEVECFAGSHIALGLLAILVLLAALILIPSVILIATGRLHKYGLKFLRPPLVLVYRDRYEWWAGVELGRRFLLLLFTVSLPQNEVVKVLVVAAYTTVYSYAQPYRSRLANYLETAINLNFLLLLLINATSFFTDEFFIFSSHDTGAVKDSDHCSGLDGIAVVSWILMPFYYLPLLGVCVTATVLAILLIREHWLREWSVREEEGQEDIGGAYNVYAVGSGPQQSWTVQLPNDITESSEGYLDFNRHSRKLSRHGVSPERKTHKNSIFKTNVISTIFTNRKT